jgi:uncharacterized protein DUF2752
MHDNVELYKDWRRNRLLLALLCTLVIGSTFFFKSWLPQLPPICPMRMTTGLPCPACGFTRSFCAVSKGNLVAAISFHLFGPVLFIIMIAAVPLSLFEIVRKRRIIIIHRILFSRLVANIFAASLIAYHCVRLVHIVSSGKIMTCIDSSLVSRIVRWVVHYWT